MFDVFNRFLGIICFVKHNNELMTSWGRVASQGEAMSQYSGAQGQTSLSFIKNLHDCGKWIYGHGGSQL